MYYHTRARFSEDDHRFISSTLTRTAGEDAAVRSLLMDAGTLSEMLHDVRLFERVMCVPPYLLAVSPHLFFYLFVYRALAAKGIHDDDLADYIAAICTEFRNNSALWQATSHQLPQDGKTIYMVDLLNLLNELDRDSQYRMRCHIGNVALFLTGLFPDFIYTRSITKAAPGFEYYESVGRAQYDAAAAQAPLLEADSAPVLAVLAEQFVVIRMAMNIYADLYLSLSSSKFSLLKLDRQAATLDAGSFRSAVGY